MINNIKKKIRWHITDIKARIGIGNAEILRRGNLPAYAPQEPRLLSIPLGDESFSSSDVLHSTFCTQEHAANVPFSLWVKTQHANECIRYYPAGLNSSENPKVMVFFPGDLTLRTTKGERRVVHSYKSNSPQKVIQAVQQWAADANIPALYVGRPGTFGSSGNHDNRRQITEIKLMNESLNLLKKKYKIGEFIVTGQSGGGQIAAAMLNLRQDISAAVITSGLLPVHFLTRRWRKIRPIPGAKKHPIEMLYDPTEGIADIPKDPQPIIIIISDPRDRVIPFNSQVLYVNRLKKEELTVHHIYAHAPLPKRHALREHGKKAAALIAKGANIEDIRIAIVSEDMRNTS
ncbi:alpha/beta hydrolase [Vreelandella nigrificans]|uniref:Alpha/beta hydrolase n=1 Tax=Vreelandella nigrificans TaxID=2042704 RepID=A0A2A4HHL8_9GAMM|nr:alpha/beta hydrolase [Halomonas nigrificans]PCF93601.1 alpha/beta hydrolase [Halomonas nigrificans]